MLVYVYVFLFICLIFFVSFQALLDSSSDTKWLGNESGVSVLGKKTTQQTKNQNTNKTTKNSFI
jgi:hypothetical protein